MAAQGWRVVESASLAPPKSHRIFCDLSETAAKNLSAITATACYPRNAVLYFEGQQCRGVFVVLAGRVKLSTCSSDGRIMILKFAGAGEVLGLPETISGKLYEARAEATESIDVYFIERANFLGFLRQHGEAAVQVARELSEACHSLMGDVRAMGLTHSASKKLARFLLHWCAANGSRNGELFAQLTVTHEEIGQTIGTSRETVTRLLSDFKRRRLIRLQHSSLLIINSAALTNHAI